MPELSPERRAAIERERNKSGSRAGFYDTKTLTDDKIRLLPLGETEDIGTKFVYYFLNNKSYCCAEETHGTPGVIAKARRALLRVGTEEAIAMEAALNKARRAKWLMKIISRKDPMTPKWFESPFAIYKIAFDAFDKDSEDVSKAVTGRDIRITKEGSGKNTEYSGRLLDVSLLHEDKEERLKLRDAGRAMDRAALIKTNESGALEALQAVIAPELWRQIRAEVTGGAEEAPAAKKPAARVDEDGDAPSRPAATEDEDAPAPAPAAKKTTARAAAPVEDDEAPPARPAPAAAPKAQTRAVPPDDDDETPVPPKASAKAAPAAAAPARRAPVPVADDDEEAPRPAANGKTGARPPVVVDDEEAAPAPAAKKTRAPADEE